jgi:hypothetical protein
MKKNIFILIALLSLLSLVSCSSVSSTEKSGKVSVRTSPSSAIIKYNDSDLKKGDMVSLIKLSWVRVGKASTQSESLIMNGVVEKVLDNNYFEVKFERNEEFSEGDKVKKI